jgi:hypothetical protein
LHADSQAAGGKVDFCWLAFEQGFAGEPTIAWLHRDKRAPQ